MNFFQRYIAFSSIVILSIICQLPSVQAGGIQPFEPINAEALIDACWKISKEDRDSGVTTRMRHGSARSIRCLQNVILDQVDAMFDPKYLSREQAKKQLRKIIEGYQPLMWSIYNEHKSCGVECGTDRHVLHLGDHAALLEDILKQMINERNEFKF